LSALAFTAPSPRQQDIGYDFFCSLISSDGQLLKAGTFFTVQAKSSEKPIIYRKKHEVEWITSQENPLLICVADRTNLSMNIYSTWNLICGPLAKGLPPRLELLPGIKRSEWPGVEHLPDGTQQIRLGLPIARVAIGEAYDDNQMEHVAGVLGDWIALDRSNMVSTRAGMHWVIGPLDYETGQSPLANAQGVAFYWHINNLPRSANNLGRAATSIALILRDALRAEEFNREYWTKKDAVLQQVLHSYWDLLDESLKQFLIGQGFGPS
jgi:hypothetical protein